MMHHHCADQTTCLMLIIISSYKERISNIKTPQQTAPQSSLLTIIATHFAFLATESAPKPKRFAPYF